MPITIKDIAQITGYSVSTVSRALNGNSRISKATRDKINEVANELNFEKNNNATSLSTSKTGNIALIYQSSLNTDGSRAYIDNLFLNIRHELNKQNLDTIICEAFDFNDNSSNSIRLIKQRKIDGLLYLHDSISRDEFIYAKKRNIPTVNIHFKPAYYDDSDYFITDNKYGGYLAGEYLYSIGCRKILIVSCDSNVGSEHKNRALGCKEAFSEHGITIPETNQLTIDTTFNSGYQLALKNYNFLKQFDGIFAQADVVASGIIAGLETKNIKVPKDIKIIGYDDCSFSTLFTPFLTTIHQPKEQIAKKSISRLVSILENPNKETTVIHEKIKPSLIIRDSA